jgi:MtN3 and saliva related transmembrane protein
MDMIWQIVGSAAATLTMFGFVPQIQKILQTRSVKNVSLPMLIQFSLGVFLWALYGVHIEDNIVILANVISLTTLIIVMGLYFKYKGKDARSF